MKDIEIDKFINLVFNPAEKRGDEIVMELNTIQRLFADKTRGEWIRESFKNVPRNNIEALAVAFFLGTVKGMEDIMKE